ncbi:DUF3575 domain-containing protein [Dyadobacter crusticola]|uniref:DUF3575 domain-containing protein n=1 Tax=Dyadobacter crusticola TaxID=292407 RepID=UPI0004E1F878|nr:DUF3575 domain-containing protein [Dyadobacter crusticola]
MKNFTSLLCSVLLLNAVVSFGQKQPDLFRRNVDVHIMPIALAFPDPSIRIGSEFMTGGRWSYGLSVGAGVRALTLGKTLFGNNKPPQYSMVEIRPEVKFYWLKRDYMGWYLAAEGIVSHVNRELGRDSHYVSDTTQIYFERSNFSKTKFGLAGKIGAKFLIPKKLTIDLYTGLGLARTNVRYTEIVNPREESYDPFFEGENFYPGKKFTPIVSVGVKFGMLVWQD